MGGGGPFLWADPNGDWLLAPPGVGGPAPPPPDMLLFMSPLLGGSGGGRPPPGAVPGVTPFRRWPGSDT
ncbi:unnamed protein product [Acanthoscelides obtectus]|uniref:Uncharacterized protein n=1 Tax=Acanthoscelides obtectus TaxID=200917 RepID=A0A9P0LJW5_ACAOB|nr:unnamed protein product [Acanthoscelides obtectus]CAK1621821.1 hypothetical protein AOBTE_LOCUS1149 [Acanthoscelides obtectus]